MLRLHALRGFILRLASFKWHHRRVGRLSCLSVCMEIIPLRLAIAVIATVAAKAPSRAQLSQVKPSQRSSRSLAASMLNLKHSASYLTQ